VWQVRRCPWRWRVTHRFVGFFLDKVFGASIEVWLWVTLEMRHR
jgi:hypothetical protein